MARRLIVDTWAFVEEALDGPRRPAVTDCLKGADRLVTVRDVVMETYSFLVARAGGSPVAHSWLERLRESRLQILDPRLSEIENFYAQVPKDAGLSLVDVSLACSAKKEGIKHILTQDSGFHAVGLEPLFDRQ